MSTHMISLMHCAIAVVVVEPFPLLFWLLIGQHVPKLWGHVDIAGQPVYAAECGGGYFKILIASLSTLLWKRFSVVWRFKKFTIWSRLSDCVSTEWCHVTENGFASITLRRSKKRGGGCAKLWLNFGLLPLQKQHRLRTFIANGGPRRRVAEAMLERRVQSEVIVCDVTGETVDPKLQTDQLKFWWVTRCIRTVVVLPNTSDSNHPNSTMRERTHIKECFWQLTRVPS